MAMQEAVEAVKSGMSQRQAARVHGVSRTGLQDRIHRDSLKVTGTSVLYDANGNVRLTWEKTGEDKDQREEDFRAALEGMKGELSPCAPVAAPTHQRADLLTVYPVGDQHLGMLAWGKETGGEDYDLTRGESLLCEAMDYLVAASPASEESAILILGDFLHTDGYAAMTPEHGNLLDADSRFPKIIKVAIRCIRYLVRAALMKHGHVRLVIEFGNHDPSSSVCLMECFAALYEVEPRVTVDTSPRPFHCFTFGKNMIGTHHGHKVKMDKLPLLFATDWPREWGETIHRVIHSGHIHQDTTKELSGATVESHRILAPADAFAANNGYRSKQGMKSIVYHREFGEVDRHTFHPRMLAA